MQKRSRWQRYLIFGVLALTVYNILPTVIFYSKPLKKAVNEQVASSVMHQAFSRVSELETESLEWITSFNKLLGIKTKSVRIDPDHPSLVQLTFKNKEDASQFSQFLPRAGASIPFVPAKLALGETSDVEVTLHRNVLTSAQNSDALFSFAAKRDENGVITPLYKEVVSDRLLSLGLAVGGISENAALLKRANMQGAEEFLTMLCQNIVSYAKVFGENSPIAKRYYATFSQGASKAELESTLTLLDGLKKQLTLHRIESEKEGKSVSLLKSKEQTVSQASQILRKNLGTFAKGKKAWKYTSLQKELKEALEPTANAHVISVAARNPLIDAIAIDWVNETIALQLHGDILSKKSTLDNAKRELLDQLLYNEVARISRISGEDLSPYRDEFSVKLNALTHSESLSVVNLSAVAKNHTATLLSLIEKEWAPTHQDLTRDVFPITEKTSEPLGLVVYAPASMDKEPEAGYNRNSVYVIAKGVEKIIEKLRAKPDSPYAKQFLADMESLTALLQRSGFNGYPSGDDFVFVNENYYQTLLGATQENFGVKGTGRFATLEYTNVEQRLLTENKLASNRHEELLKWRDDYKTAQVNPDGTTKYSVPEPTKNVLFSNFKLACMKYFRGDERKILHWGLDLSGGKTVQIELRDQNGRVVTDEADLDQGINELYSRVNKMGVSEVSIRREGSNITLDFPSAQGLSATDLVKASSMYFHIVNEQFSGRNRALAEATNHFLQSVWNEAVVTGRTNSENINQIAWKQLHTEAKSDTAKLLYDNGLRLSHPGKTISTDSFDDTLSKIAIFRGESSAEWEGQSHPLLVVFNNYALEGSNLQNVHGSYDPSQGNYLVFEVKNQSTKAFETWTAPFAKSTVQGTKYEQYVRSGWRMAVNLNGSVISAPTLNEPLKNRASITGQFTNREINLLEADLKAGSLTYAPHILSEKNVSPELGAHDRIMGIVATVLALMLVIAVMIGYYRFAGIVASIAVIVNLLIMWAALQNIQATITLAGIAGIILTLGMAVDANVLVFERIREELKGGATFTSAISLGYKKAFSAIIDSNLTTIIAAVILLNFDSGPIKGFALTLIIGIVSSMFTALFMTRYFFTRWAAKHKTTTLKMASLIKESAIDFLKYGKAVIGASIVVALVGGFLLVKERSSMFGMDFTGGYSLTLDVEPESTTTYRASVESALEKAGLSSSEYQVRELTPANSIKLLLSRTLDNAGNAFDGMPLEIADSDDTYAFMKNPRIDWVVNSLKAEGLKITPSSLSALDSTWSSVSGQMSDSMRNNALIGLGLALLCILGYITYRFEFTYAISATIGLAFDLSVAIGLLAILNTLGVPIQIDLNTIAALMTIIGYSLNDTIIIFDRIREDLRKTKKMPLRDLINHALNTTLSRTIMTSTTTLVVLLSLVTLGGSTIFGLALVMIIGVVYGTLSSLTVAAPLLLYFYKREKQRAQAKT